MFAFSLAAVSTEDANPDGPGGEGGSSTGVNDASESQAQHFPKHSGPAWGGVNAHRSIISGGVCQQTIPTKRLLSREGTDGLHRVSHQCF